MNEPCSNCRETRRPCACRRNRCNSCGNPVGNITFSVCDDCWDLPTTMKPADQESLIDQRSTHGMVRAPDLGTDWQGIAKALAVALRCQPVSMSPAVRASKRSALFLYDEASR